MLNRQHFNEMKSDEDYTNLIKATDEELIHVGPEFDGVDMRYYCTHNDPDYPASKYDPEWTPTPPPPPTPPTAEAHIHKKHVIQAGTGFTVDELIRDIPSLHQRNPNEFIIGQREETGETTTSAVPLALLNDYESNTGFSSPLPDTHQSASFQFGVSIEKDDNYQAENEEEAIKKVDEVNEDDKDNEEDQQDDYDKDYEAEYEDEESEESEEDEDDEESEEDQDSDMHSYGQNTQRRRINYSFVNNPPNLHSVPNMNMEASTDFHVPHSGLPYSANDQDDDEDGY